MAGAFPQLDLKEAAAVNQSGCSLWAIDL